MSECVDALLPRCLLRRPLEMEFHPFQTQQWRVPCSSDTGKSSSFKTQNNKPNPNFKLLHILHTKDQRVHMTEGMLHKSSGRRAQLEHSWSAAGVHSFLMCGLRLSRTIETVFTFLNYVLDALFTSPSLPHPLRSHRMATVTRKLQRRTLPLWITLCFLSSNHRTSYLLFHSQLQTAADGAHGL